MAKFLGKDPFTYEKEKESFLAELKQFHASRGSTFIRQPSIGGKEVDLFLLYNKVCLLGGYDKINGILAWEEMIEDYGIPKLCTNGAQAIKQFYQRFLYLYEKVSKGEDPDQREEGDEPTAKRKKIDLFFSAVPNRYNFQQHYVGDTVRRNLGLSTDFARKDQYDKLEKALLCGLPNEVDFAINVCTLLSNEGKQSLSISNNPRLIDILMAHAGIFRQGAGSLFTLHHEGWRPCTKRSFERFWIDSVEDKEIRDLVTPLIENDRGERMSKTGFADKSDEEEIRNNILHMGPDLGVHNVEGQRILQLAMILRNLSFEEENMAYLASNLLVFRFLMLCIHNKYWTLKQLGLDTFGNLALKMELDPLDYPTTQLVLGLVTRCISSPDRFEVVRGLEILARLCQVVNNWDLVAENLEHRVYEDMVGLLTVHDIQLIVFTLEALYHLTELGEASSNHIAKVASSIDTLVHMVTIEAQAYGPNSLLGIKVVEHVPAGSGAQQQQHPGGVQPQFLQRPGMPRQPQHIPGRMIGTPQGAPMVPTPPRPGVVPTPPPGQLQRPGVTPTPPPPFRKGPVATPPQPGLRQGMMNTPPRPGMHRPGVSPQTTPGVRSNMPPGYMVHRNLVNRPRPQQPVVNQAECDAIAVAWLHAYYEAVPGFVAVKNEVYAEYLATCSRFTIKNALNSTGFSDCIKTAFPQIQQNRIERDDGTLEMQLIGIMRRSVPQAFPPPPKRLVTGYISTLGGLKPVVQYSAQTAGAPVPNFPAVNRSGVPSRPPPVPATVPPAVPLAARPPQEDQGTVVIKAQGLHPVLQVQQQQTVSTPPQTPPLSSVPSGSSQAAELNVTTSMREEPMETGETQREACMPVNRPPSRRRSCSGSSSQASPPLSPRARSPRSPRSKSPRPNSPKATRQSPRLNSNINSDVSHAQMERIDDQLTAPILETAIEKVENPSAKAAEHAGPNNRSGESRGKQNGSVNVTNDESHPPLLHINGDVFSPAPSESSTTTADPLSPKRNGAASNPATSPSILDKKAKIAQLLQDTAAAKEVLGLGQNGIVPHFGNGDCVDDGSTDPGQGGLPSAEGLTKQMSEAAALLPETNGCDDDYLGNSTDGANDHLYDENDATFLGCSVDGTNDNLEDGEDSSGDTVGNMATTGRAAESSESVAQTVIANAQPSQLQGSTLASQNNSSSGTTSTPLECTSQPFAPVDQTSGQANTTVTGPLVGQANGQMAMTVSAQPTASQVLLVQSNTGNAAVAGPVLQQAPVTSQTQLNVQGMPRMPGAPVQQVMQANLAAPARTLGPQSHVMQQLQMRLQRPNTTGLVSAVSQALCQPSQSQASMVPSDPTVAQPVPVTVSHVTPTHAAVQQQLLQRLRAPHLVQQHQQPQVLQPRLQASHNPGGTTVLLVQGQPAQQPLVVQQESNSRPSSVGPLSRPPSRPPSAGPALARPPSTGPVPMPSPSGSDSSTLPPASPPPAGQQTSRRPSTASTASNDSKSGTKRKVKSNSIESRRSSNTSVSSDSQFVCEWNACGMTFESAKAVNVHVIKEHVIQLPSQGLCPWDTCDGLRRGKWSLLTHVQDRHLTEAALKAASGKRQHQQPSTSTPAPSAQSNANSSSSGSAPVYPQDAALQAIRRFAPRPPYPELGEMKEGPVTKHIRLTSALILRNVAKYSSFGRSLLKRHESHLACMALSAVEASTALSHVLAELTHHTLTSPAAKPEESDAEDDDDDEQNSDSDVESERTDTADATDLDLSQEVLAH